MVEDEGGDAVQLRQQPDELGARPAGRRRPGGPGRGEVVQVTAFDVVEPQGPGQRVEDLG